MLNEIVLFVAVGGLITSTAFLCLVIFSARRFRRRAPLQATPAGQLPPVTLLKPLYGLEPNLEDNLASFFEQDYPAPIEVIFGTRNAQDPALTIVQRLADRYPHVSVRTVFAGEPDHPNAKVCSLVHMYARASHDYIVISDSDVHVGRDYLRTVIQPLLNPRVGLVTCLYRGAPAGGLWSKLEALGMSVEMTSGVIVADLLEGMKFALGPSMSFRRDALEAIGGMKSLADYCADDYVLGNEVARHGYTVVLSSYVVDHMVTNCSFKPSLLHQVRWMKSTRFSRPSGHLGTVLTFSMIFGVIGAIGSLVADNPILAAALFGWALLNRMVLAIVSGWYVVRDRRALQLCWLYPLRDFMGFFVWCASYLGNEIVWRDDVYRLEARGKMVRIGSASPSDSKSAPVAVNHLT